MHCCCIEEIGAQLNLTWYEKLARREYVCAIVDDSSMSDDALCCNLAGRVLRLAELTPDLASLKPPATQIFTEEHARENDKKSTFNIVTLLVWVIYLQTATHQCCNGAPMTGEKKTVCVWERGGVEGIVVSLLVHQPHDRGGATVSHCVCTDQGGHYII